MNRGKRKLFYLCAHIPPQTKKEQEEETNKVISQGTLTEMSTEAHLKATPNMWR